MPIFENQRSFSRKNFPRSRFGNISQAVIEWRKRAINAGSSHISMTTMKATDFLYKEMKKNGLLYKMKSVVGFCPCNLIAATTPIYYTHGNSPWINVNNNNFIFNDSDLNIHGLKGGGGESFFVYYGKYLNTGLNPSIIYSNNNSAGVTLYTTESNTGGETDIGCAFIKVDDPNGDILRNRMSFQVSFNVNNIQYSQMACYNLNNNNGLLNAVNSDNLGYLSFNRESFNYLAIYKFNSKNSHNPLVKSFNKNATERPNLNLYCFALNQYDIFNSSSSAESYSTKRFSFAAVHEGLTENESRAFSWIIQNYRIKLGGGFI